MPDNRELATAILLFGFLSFSLTVPAVRRQIPSILGSVAPLAWLFLVYLTTASALVWAAWSVGLWTPDLWWSTLIVVLGLGIALVSSAVNARSVRALREAVASRTLGAAVLFGLYTNAATFPLVVEIVLQALAALAVMVRVVANHQGQKPARQLADVVLALIGLAVVARTTLVLSHGMPADQWLTLLRQALLSIWFPFALAPLLYLVAYLSTVEKAAIGVRIVRPRENAKWPVMSHLLLAFRFRLSLAEGFDRAWGRRYADASDSRGRRLVVSRFRAIQRPRFELTRQPALARLRRALGRHDASSVWDGREMPRSPAHLAQMLDMKPPGWEWMAFGAHLWIFLAGQRGKYRAHRRRRAARSSEYRIGPDKAIPHLADAVAAGGHLPASIVDVLGEARQEAAFGPPGKQRNPAEIQEMASDVVSVYVALLDWASELRGARLPRRYRRAYRAAARMVDGPIEQIRHFAAALADQLDAIPQHVASRSTRQLTITMSLTLSLRPEDQERFDRELSRLAEGPGLRWLAGGAPRAASQPSPPA